MKQPTIAVFGDEFRDRYWLGTTTRISPEAPIPVVKITTTHEFPGGAGNVMANLLALGASVIGSGPAYSKLPVKNRLCIGDYQLARWDENDVIPEANIEPIKNFRADGVIVSDYGKGSITYAVIEAIAELNLPTFIDTKRSPRDFDVVQNPIFFPNFKEYLEHLDDYRIQPDVILKRGEHGIEHMQFGMQNEYLPAWAEKVVSVCGAGDTVIAAYAYAVLTNDKAPLYFANKAAAVVVEKPWTATASHSEIEEKFWELSKQGKL